MSSALSEATQYTLDMYKAEAMLTALSQSACKHNKYYILIS